MISLGSGADMIFNVGGHTKGHIAYYFFESSSFLSEILYSCSMRSLLEGTPQQMWSSFKNSQFLPETLIYCAHEYTEANVRFAETIDPDNQNLMERVADIKALRSADKPTVPASIVPFATNPFLRAGDPSIQNHLGMAGANIVDVFAEIRTLKDNY